MAVNKSTNTDRPAGKGARKAQGKANEAHVAHALKAAYEAAVREEVPDEFRDLLDKLR